MIWIYAKIFTLFTYWYYDLISYTSSCVYIYTYSNVNIFRCIIDLCKYIYIYIYMTHTYHLSSYNHMQRRLPWLSRPGSIGLIYCNESWLHRFQLLRLVKFPRHSGRGKCHHDVIMMVHNPKHIMWKWPEKDDWNCSILACFVINLKGHKGETASSCCSVLSI